MSDDAKLEKALDFLPQMLHEGGFRQHQKLRRELRRLAKSTCNADLERACNMLLNDFEHLTSNGLTEREAARVILSKRGGIK